VAQISRKSTRTTRIAADWTVLALLQHAEELGLQIRRHLADLVQQKRPALRLLEQPVLVGHGARERSAPVAEQFRLDEVLRDRRAVDLDERALRPPAVVVQRVGDELLARAVFALNQDVGLGIGHRGHQVEQLAHLAAAPDDVVELVAVAELPLERDVLRFQIHALDGARQHREDAVRIDGLLEKVGGAGLDRLDRARNAALPADYQHFRARLQRLEPADELCPIGIGQHEVHQRGIRQPGREGFRRLGTAHRDPRVVACARHHD
jgi:hypothetical protein